MTQLLENIEIETAPNPQVAVIWLHGLGADGNDFVPLVNELDPGRRFVPSSASGPRFMANAADFGRGLHWDVHGPWKPEGMLAEWAAYWEKDDALFRSETGAPGASPLDILERQLRINKNSI